jgi:hypothetical protein
VRRAASRRDSLLSRASGGFHRSVIITGESVKGYARNASKNEGLLSDWPDGSCSHGINNQLLASAGAWAGETEPSPSVLIDHLD